MPFSSDTGTLRMTDRIAISISRVSVLTRDNNDMRIKLSFSLHFYLLYLLLNSCDGNEAKQHVFLGRRLMTRQRARFSLPDVQSDVLLPSCLHIMAFSIGQLLCLWMIFLICLRMCQCGAASSRWWQRLVSRTGVCSTHVLAPVHNSVVNRTVWRTQIWKYKIRCFLLKELDCFTGIGWHRNASFLPQLSKSK